MEGEAGAQRGPGTYSRSQGQKVAELRFKLRTSGLQYVPGVGPVIQEPQATPNGPAGALIVLPRAPEGGRAVSAPSEQPSLSALGPLTTGSSPPGLSTVSLLCRFSGNGAADTPAQPRALQHSIIQLIGLFRATSLLSPCLELGFSSRFLQGYCLSEERSPQTQRKQNTQPSGCQVCFNQH